MKIFFRIRAVLPIYNRREIPELQIHQPRIPGLRKGIRDCNP